MRAGGLLPLTITMNLIINSSEIKSNCVGMCASWSCRTHSHYYRSTESGNFGAMLLHESTFATVQRTSARVVRWTALQIISNNNGHNGQMAR